MNNPNEPFKINGQNNYYNIQKDEKMINTESINIERNKQIDNNMNRQKSNEEEKNNKEIQHLFMKQQEIELLEKIKAQKELQLNQLENNYEVLLNDIFLKWENDKSNFEEFYNNYINSEIRNMLLTPCIVCNQDKIILIFKFLCRYFYFLKDNLKEIPIQVLNILDDFLNKDKAIIFSSNKESNNNNQIDSEYNEIIGDKLFFNLFKEILPNGKIENSDFDLEFNCMFKYFREFLFNIEFYKNFFNDFLSRKDMTCLNYNTFCFYSFKILSQCDDNFIRTNEYNIILIRNYYRNMNYYIDNCFQQYLNENKNACIEMINSIENSYFNIIFGALTRILDILKQNNLEQEAENFCFSIYKSIEFFIKQHKLDLRIFAIEKFSNIAHSYKTNDDKLKLYYNGREEVLDYTKILYIKFLKKINIFDLVFGENIHEALIERSYNIFSLLYKNNNFSNDQISLLWKISQSKYQSINNSIIAFFGKLLPEFSNQDCNNILDIIYNINYNEVNEITLKLLENFFQSEQRHETLLKILFKYSNELSHLKGLSFNIIEKSRNILIKLLFNKIYADDLHDCIKNCLFCINNNYLMNTHLTILIDIINHFIQNQKNENTIEIFKLINNHIDNYPLFISFLNEKYSILNIIFHHLFFMKKLFTFLVDEAIKIKKLIDDGNFDFDYLLNLEKLFEEYKKYKQINYINSNNNIGENYKMEIYNEKPINKQSNYLLPENKNDIENYLKTIINDFIYYFRNKLLKEKINLTNNEIINKIFSQFEFSFKENTYQVVLNKLIDITFNIHEMSNININRTYIEILYNLLIENSLINEERKIFYKFFEKAITNQFKNKNLNLIKDEDIQYLCLEKISSNEVINLPFPAYEIMYLFVIYVNEKNGNITYCHETKKFIDIKKLNLMIGFKTLLEFDICTRDSNIIINASQALNNIIEVASRDMINRKYVLEILFALLKKYKLLIKEDVNKYSIEKTGFRRILRLISTVNKTKVSKNLYDKNDPNNILVLNINNNFFISNDNNYTHFTIFKGLTIQEFKDELNEKIICNDQNNILLFNNLSNFCHQNVSTLEELKTEIREKNLIILYYNSQILNNNFTLADYNIKSNENILILNRNNEFQMTEDQLKEGYSQIKVVFNDKYNEEIMKEALYKLKGDIYNAIIYMTNQENISNLMKEIEEKKKYIPKKREELICLEENKFNLLLEILDEGNNDLNNSIWDLFAEIKFPEIFIMNSIGTEFDNILKENNFNKILLILKIINSVIFDDESFCKNNKINKNIKDQWISKFINNGELVIKILYNISKLNIDENNQITYSKIISIIINWFKNIFNKISNLIKNKNNINSNINIEDSGSNYNLLIDNNNNDKEEPPKFENNKEEIYGEFDISEGEAFNFLEMLGKNNFAYYIYNILGIILELIKIQPRQESKNIINSLYNILLEYSEININNIFQFFEEEKKQKKFLSIFLLLKEKDVQKSSFDFLKKLLDYLKLYNSNDSNIINHINIQSLLLNCYYPELISDEVYNEEFYELYSFLINFEVIKQNIIPINKIIEKFLNYLCDVYDNYKNINLIINDKENNQKIKSKINFNLYILCCFNTYYKEILENEIEKKFREKKDIITILYNFLFKLEKINDNFEYFFSNDQLRSNAFNFLSILISIGKKYFDIISIKIINHHKFIDQKINGLSLEDPLRNFETQKFIGLVNLGATCYLNSLFQQMFMIPTLYEDLLNFNITNENEDLKNSTIYNMQLTFINLKKSCLKFYSPINFINSFKEAFNGQPIKLGVQQDADEFLAILCDKLEKEAKKYGKENFLENSFKGKITNEIVSLEHEYPYYSQAEEPFFRITLDIKGHKKLEEALDAYIKGEILEGENKYFVEKYNKKLSIKKRTSIKKIGNQIIIHLKRFEFDFITFQNNKLNDYLEFPLKLNFKKWTRAFLRINEVNSYDNNIISEEEKENLNDEKMNYELTGILIHSGASIQSGHYYSFIKDQETNKWYKFNDSQISEYDINKDLEKECFGNIDNKINKYGKVAYLLFYTRKECIDSYKHFEKNIKINESVLKQVESENINYIQIKTFSSDIYQKFLITFINCSLNYLIGEEYNDNIQEKDEYSILINDEIKKEIKIYDKVKSMLNGNKENNVNIYESEITNLPVNIEQIYEKCKTEIIFDEEEKKNNNSNKNIENVTLKHIIKLVYFYTFGIIFQYCDKEQNLNQFLIIIIQILQKYPNYCVLILQMIEKNIDIFINLLFKYGFIDKDMTGINRAIANLYLILFNYIYNFEKQKNGYITNETFHYFVKDDKGKFIIEKQYKSLFLRTFKKIFCSNLEKCRKEYLRDFLFLYLFNSIISQLPESCIVSSDYLLSLISFITNNNLQMFKSEANPNYKMGNNFQNFVPNELYMISFSNIILRCVTPGMILSKTKSPFFISGNNFNEDNKDFSLYPKLPKDWRKILIKEFFVDYILFCPKNEPISILYHLSFNDKKTSIIIMQLLNNCLKQQIYYYSDFEKVIFRACDVFNLNDNLNEIRLDILFELNKNENENQTLLNFYIMQKNNYPNIVLCGIYYISKIIEKYNNAFIYFMRYKKKLSWIKDYYIEVMINAEDKTSNFYKIIEKDLGKFPDLFQTIENQFINKLEI